MNAIDAVTVIRMLRMKLETTAQTDPGAAVLQRVIDHLGMQVKFLTEPEINAGPPKTEPTEEQVRILGPWMRPDVAREVLQKIFELRPKSTPAPTPVDPTELNIPASAVEQVRNLQRRMSPKSMFSSDEIRALIDANPGAVFYTEPLAGTPPLQAEAAIGDGGPAFPWGEHGDRLGGMTMRDVFACHAPDVPDDFGWKDGETDTVQRLVRWRWHYADAMLKARQS